MRKHLRCLIYLLKHKWFVLAAGLRVGAPLWLLIIHDWTKLTRSEWTPYARKYFSDKPLMIWQQWDFEDAWLHHWQNNPHHWQYWHFAEWDECDEMPEKYAREMVADWMGANRAQTGEWNVIDWYAKNKEGIKLHDETRALVEEILGWRK